MPQSLPIAQPLTERQLQCLDRYKRGLELLTRHFGRRFPLRMVQVFLTVYLKEPVSRREVSQAVAGLPHAILTDLRVLGDEGHQGRRGLGMITWRLSGDSMPHREYTLTSRGKALAEEYGAILLGEAPGS